MASSLVRFSLAVQLLVAYHRIPLQLRRRRKARSLSLATMDSRNEGMRSSTWEGFKATEATGVGTARYLMAARLQYLYNERRREVVASVSSSSRPRRRRKISRSRSRRDSSSLLSLTLLTYRQVYRTTSRLLLTSPPRPSPCLHSSSSHFSFLCPALPAPAQIFPPSPPSRSHHLPKRPR